MQAHEALKHIHDKKILTKSIATWEQLNLHRVIVDCRYTPKNIGTESYFYTTASSEIN